MHCLHRILFCTNVYASYIMMKTDCLTEPLNLDWSFILRDGGLGKGCLYLYKHNYWRRFIAQKDNIHHFDISDSNEIFVIRFVHDLNHRAVNQSVSIQVGVVYRQTMPVRSGLWCTFADSECLQANKTLYKWASMMAHISV